jgi:nicotinate phosphoribosyltransferase
MFPVSAVQGLPGRGGYMIIHRTGPLFTDLYELTMAAGYYHHRIRGRATFSLFIRDYHRQRSFYLMAGLGEVLRELAAFGFNREEIHYLRQTGLFTPDFLDYLAAMRFSGDVYALAEGTVFFANEPILEIDAPIDQAQLLETYLLNTIGFQTLIATKAARGVHAASGRPVIDFSLRRTQGHDAGLKVARSSYIAGFEATSNVLAGKLYDIPVSGTMAHSFVTAFEKEIDAFRAYADAFPDKCVLLIDTYDTIRGAGKAVEIARYLRQKGASLVGVRLDSGDMVSLSTEVRRILDDAGFTDVKIFASSGLDEFSIARLLAEGARIDAFGVGTRMGVSADAPYLDIVYKMVSFNGRNVRKLSPGKATLAGRKQVFRRFDGGGNCQEDIIALRDERIPEALPLLVPVMQQGKLTGPEPSLEAIRRGAGENMKQLDARYKKPEADSSYPVSISTGLLEIQK